MDVLSEFSTCYVMEHLEYTLFARNMSIGNMRLKSSKNYDTFKKQRQTESPMLTLKSCFYKKIF